MQSPKLIIRVATAEDRERIYRIRHDVYAKELGQHHENEGGVLKDALDEFNIYLVAIKDDEMAGFVSITPPGHGKYSIDKYIERSEAPFDSWDGVYEARLLTVCEGHRNQVITPLLIIGAVRYIQASGGTHVIIMGRREIKTIYEKLGFESVGCEIVSGAVTYDLMAVNIAIAPEKIAYYAAPIRKLEQMADWQIEGHKLGERHCQHGGAFFSAIGDTFETLQRSEEVINADVLDAWFLPAPSVISAVEAHLPWLLKTSPPADADGLIRTIAEVRGVPKESLAVGAGSSSLIYQAFRLWLNAESKVLIPDPTYGEYGHILERIIGCQVDRLPLSRGDKYAIDPARILEKLNETQYDLMVLVNPNNPTGGMMQRVVLEEMISASPKKTRFWIDEAYMDYVGAEHSLETFAAASSNTFVCKSLSKCYALSGVRAAYVCGPADPVWDLREITPPWAVSLPAQVAAVAALKAPDYYLARYAETHRLRDELMSLLRDVAPAVDYLPGDANFVLCHLPLDGPSAATICRRCRAKDIFLRDASSISPQFGTHVVRIAVKDADSNRKVVAAFKAALS